MTQIETIKNEYRALIRLAMVNYYGTTLYTVPNFTKELTCLGEKYLKYLKSLNDENILKDYNNYYNKIKDIVHANYASIPNPVTHIKQIVNLFSYLLYTPAEITESIDLLIEQTINIYAIEHISDTEIYDLLYNNIVGGSVPPRLDNPIDTYHIVLNIKNKYKDASEDLNDSYIETNEEIEALREVIINQINYCNKLYKYVSYFPDLAVNYLIQLDKCIMFKFLFEIQISSVWNKSYSID